MKPPGRSFVSRSLKLLVACGLLGGADVAAADSNVWRRAATPSQAATEDTLNEGRRQLDQYVTTVAGVDTSESIATYLFAAKSLLEKQHAESADAPSMRYLAARIEQALHARDHDLAHLEKAIVLLRWVVAPERKLPIELRAAALFELAVCCAHLGRRADEITAYVTDLEIEPNALHRSLIFANQADALMNRGDLEAAKRGYRNALNLLTGVVISVVGATTLWGLAVALDRSGDLPRALETVALARSYDPTDSQLRGPNWFFVPARESYWYDALGHWTRARATTEPGEQQKAYAKAEASFRSYAASSPLDDRWRTLGNVRATQCAKEAVKARTSGPSGL